MSITYSITDTQSGEIVSINQSESDLTIFANDLYWQDGVDFNVVSIDKVIEAIEKCDYSVQRMSERV